MTIHPRRLIGLATAQAVGRRLGAPHGIVGTTMIPGTGILGTGTIRSTTAHGTAGAIRFTIARGIRLAITATIVLGMVVDTSAEVRAGICRQICVLMTVGTTIPMAADVTV